MRRPSARAWVSLAVAFGVGSLYLWIARAAGEPFYWKRDLGGYYDYLSRGLLSGHLYLPITPSPELLALPNPWDPKVDEALKMHDMALFNGRYYLYHGAGPAVLLFTPWRLVTGHDLPENFAVFLLCLGGFVFAAGALAGLLELAEATPCAAVWAVMLIALGTCQCVPYLLNRVAMYEVAIGGGYFCMSAAIFFLVRAVRRSFHASCLALSGLWFGLTIACRPHLGLAGAVALVGIGIAVKKMRPVAAFVLPLALVASAVVLYNYARFGNPLEFGVNYLLAGGENQQLVKLAAEFVPPGLYFLAFNAPRFTPVFPWVAQIIRCPLSSPDCALPKEYFIEPTAGALYLAPFLAGILLARKSPARMILCVLAGTAAAVLLFLASTGFTTQRYEVDFLPSAVLAALASIGIAIARSGGWRRITLTASFVALAGFGVVVNLALGLGGPSDGLLKHRPRTYLRLARWLSPVEEYRPLLNPRVSVDFAAEFGASWDGMREPLVTIGDRIYRHILYAEHGRRRVLLVSQGDGSTVRREIDRPAGALRMRLDYEPESGRIRVAVNGEEVLVHEIKTLVTAPWQVRVGENLIEPGICEERFTGQIWSFSKVVRAATLRPET